MAFEAATDEPLDASRGASPRGASPEKHHGGKRHDGDEQDEHDDGTSTAALVLRESHAPPPYSCESDEPSASVAVPSSLIERSGCPSGSVDDEPPDASLWAAICELALSSSASVAEVPMR